MRALILGAGASGLLHALSLRAHGVAIDSVYDPDLDRARSLASLVRARALPSLDAAYGSDASVVAVCGPPTSHAPQAIALARAGRVVFVEKPIALDADSLDRLEPLEGVVPVVQWRFGRALRAIQHAIAWGELGSAPSVAIDLAWRRDAAYFAAGRATWASWGCGALLSVGIHALDAALFALGGRVAHVMGIVGGPRRQGVEVDTGAVVCLATASGAMISLRITLDAAADRTRMAFTGGGVTAIIEGTEEDPTASDVIWHADAPTRARLLRLEAEEAGYRAAPLLVPYLGRGLERLAESPLIGPDLAVPSVRGVAPAHRAIFDVVARSRVDEERAAPPRRARVP